jgi:hypothetical protein
MLPTSTAEVIHLTDCDDIVSWINDALQPPGTQDTDSVLDLSELDQRVSNLATTVDIACEDTVSQLERIIDDVSRGVPRLTYDLHFMKDGALSLQSALSKVQEKANSTPEAMASALDRLQYLDTVKRNMEAARDVLREAESWSTLEMEVTSLLSEHSYGKAAERLSEASKSMAVFENTPEYESRRTLMVSLQNQLEASLSSALVAAITSQDVAVCRDYFSIFTNIQRESEFRNYYNGSRRASLVAQWQETHLVDCDLSPPSGSTSSQTLSGFLPKFYASFLSLLDVERTSIPSVFPDPLQTMSSLITSVLSALQPTFSQRLAALFNHYGASGLKEAITVFKATKDFAAAAEKILEKVRFTSPWTASPDTGSLQKSHSRRRSTRMSMSWRPGQHRTSGSISIKPSLAGIELEWDQELFQPFLDFQSDYGSLEKRLLDDSLSEIVNAGEVLADSDRGRLLRERSVDLCRVAEEGMSRCMEFTHGYGSVGLVEALDYLFKSFMDMWTADVSSQRRSSASVMQSEDDLSDLDYTEEDWSNFQLSIHLLAAAKSVFERTITFESKLRSMLVQIATTFRMARNDPSNFLVLGMTNGESQLLAQSTLNSAELNALLTNVETETSVHVSAPFPTTPVSTRPTHSGSPAPLLVDGRAAISSFSKACQLSLQETILSPLRRHFTSYASLHLWSVQGDPKAKRTTSNELPVPSFSLSPTDIVQRVAEGMLNLPRLFEVYADDDALSFSLQTLPYVDAELLKSLSEQPVVVVGTNEPQTPSHARRPSYVSKPSPSLLTPEAVSSAWLSSLGHSILTYYTANVIPSIRILTAAGAAQLATDLAYLSNIVRALNVEHAELERWKECSEMDDETGRKKMSERENGDPVLERIAKMRGWTVL